MGAMFRSDPDGPERDAGAIFGCVKQYSSDVLVAVILNVARRLGAAAEQRPREVPDFLGAVGAILVGCSHASVFVLGGIGLTLIGTALADRRYRDVLGWVIVSSTWFLIFLTIYLFVDRYSASNSYLVQFWAKKFAPFPPRSLEQAKWYYDNALVGLFTGPLGMSQGQLAATGFFFGVYLLAIRGQVALANPLGFATVIGPRGLSPEKIPLR